MQSFTVPSAVYAMRLPCAEYARAKAAWWAVRLDRTESSICKQPDGWFYCSCGEHRFNWEMPKPEDVGWAV